MSTLPGSKDLTLYRGDTFSMTLTYKEDAVGVSLTGATVLAQIRPAIDSATISATFTATLSNQTTSPGEVTLTLPAATTAALAITSGVYDVEITWPSGSVQTILYGTVSINKDVTEAP